MSETVTVDKAIARGHRIITFPAFVVLFALPILFVVLTLKGVTPFWWVPVALIPGLFLALLYSSFMVTKWRLWAFSNVRNVHELKERAIHEGLIWRDESFFGKREIRNAGEQQTWAMLQSKFDQEDEFYDDPSVPEETVIYYAKTKKYEDVQYRIAGIVLGIGLGVFLAVKIGHLLYSPAILILGYLGYRVFGTSHLKDPQIIISNKGIGIGKEAFYEWNTIENEDAVFYLMFNVPGGTKQINLEGLGTTSRKLKRLLMLYRRRYEQGKEDSRKRNMANPGNE